MKKKGSVLILSLLMLSFFMTITLTMYYMARNRNRRSIYKVKGIRINGSLDSGSAIAHYELYLADEYVSRGYPYSTSASAVANYVVDDDYSEPSSTTQYTQEVTSGSDIIIMPKTDNHYTGVVLNNYNEYFASYWDSEAGTATIPSTTLGVTAVQSIQPWIAEDKVVDGDLVSRAWMNNTGEKVIRLWTEALGSEVSVGGYRLIDVSGTYMDASPVVAPLDPLKLDSTTLTSIGLTYEKIVSMDKTILLGTGTEDYRITYVEEAKVIPSGSSIIINSDELKSMTIEKLK